MNETGWLILATIAGPVVGALIATVVTGALRQLASARARRIQHIPARGADLYRYGVPLTEPQFRGLYAAYQAELATLAPPAERTEWELKQQYAAAQRLAVLTGTHPNAFPSLGDADQAWEWYAASNWYTTQTTPENPCTLQALMQIPGRTGGKFELP
jgi:hypothetical protein